LRRVEKKFKEKQGESSREDSSPRTIKQERSLTGKKTKLVGGGGKKRGRMQKEDEKVKLRSVALPVLGRERSFRRLATKKETESRKENYAGPESSWVVIAWAAASRIEKKNLWRRRKGKGVARRYWGERTRGKKLQSPGKKKK